MDVGLGGAGEFSGRSLVGAGFEAGDATGDGQGDEVGERDERRGEDEPGDDGVKRGGAEVAEEKRGMVPEQVAHVADIEGDGGGTAEVFAETDEAVHRGDVDGPAGLVEQVDDRLVEAQCNGGGDTQERGGAEDGKQGAGGADGEGEGDFFGRDALGELGDERIADAALPEGARRERRGGGRRRVGGSHAGGSQRRGADAGDAQSASGASGVSDGVGDDDGVLQQGAEGTKRGVKRAGFGSWFWGEA